MSHYDDQMKNTKNYSDRFKYLKKITQILLPFSLLSLFLSLFLSHSSLSPLFLQSYDYLDSNFNFNFNFKFKLFTYTTEMQWDSYLVEEDLHVEKWDKRGGGDDDDDDDDDDDQGIDREELERKCEDFIKKVKMEIQSA
ncbi:hypothetical protein AAHA92_11101 [Salvia divinorum]|uniref:Transmembrane protein n=1 Tax=Salvia divinorum TaxID=28513 RepID=A0ABD1I0W2_SALDI